MATTPARPYRFPALPEQEEAADERAATRCSRQSCGTCSASAVASCVALCCCPCAVVGCLTLALVKAPYAAGRRCAARLARRRTLKARARRVRDLDVDDELQRKQVGPRRSKEWGEMARAAAVGAAEGREKVSSRMDSSEKVWADMYQVGLWGFGRLSFSAPVAAGGGDLQKDGDAASE
ncbi:hypothetical protein BAE44_0022411 [Dichanthelium oligosanthes]|uniref:Uncharacterized protein n=1 Tax=Dichanthelium oligosanthes TaxID=888268 RepID=A0A1E5UUN2_9POAL|nr:hypothetical protein BAE44_0022411 [Dichanthelium oligosanthes]